MDIWVLAYVFKEKKWRGAGGGAHSPSLPNAPDYVSSIRKQCVVRARELAQWLKALSAHLNNPDWIPSTLIAAHRCLKVHIQETWCPLLISLGPKHLSRTQTDIHAVKTAILKRNAQPRMVAHVCSFNT